MGLMNIMSREIENLKFVIACDKCHCHFLLEIITMEDNIFIRKYCFCGESTSPINNQKIQILYDIEEYKKLRCFCSTQSLKIVYKYCNDCQRFFCEDCTIKHNHHKQMDPNNFLINCYYHVNDKIIGFCKTCIKPICKICIDNKHKNHKIEYNKNLKINDDILNEYMNNLNKAISEFDKLIKVKYGNSISVSIENLNFLQGKMFFKKKDRQILNCLLVLKTIIDSYYYYKKIGQLNYQLISNILKNIKMEIITLPDSIEFNKNNCINGIGVTNKEIKNEKKNREINISLNIKLKRKEIKKKKILIKFIKKNDDNKYIQVNKVIKLNNGNFAYCFYDEPFSSSFIYFFKKDLKQKELCIKINHNYILNFIELENEKIVILTLNNILLYYYNKLKNNFSLEKEIILNINNDRYDNLINISNNNFAKLSFYSDATFLDLFIFPNYKIENIRIINEKAKISKLLFNNNIIIIFITCSYSLKVYFYEIENRSLDDISIKLQKEIYNKKLLSCLNICKDRVLLLYDYTFIIINSKTKQINTIIKTSYKTITGLIRKKNITLIADSYNISQIELKNGEIYQNYCALSKEDIVSDIVSILDVGDNQFCSINTDGSIILYKYKYT